MKLTKATEPRTVVDVPLPSEASAAAAACTSRWLTRDH